MSLSTVGDTILSTKLHVPLVPEQVVQRVGLFEQLDQGLTRKLILVSAPAGFGKTTLAAMWLEERGIQAAWVSLDSGDNTPARFFAHLITALKRRDASLGNALQGSLDDLASLPNDAILSTLVNDISALDEKLILVLDDYHVIEAKAVHDAMRFLLEHQPPNLHLLVTTRADPPWPLARLRARRRLVEVRAKDLRFQSAESSSFLNEMMRLELAKEHVEALQIRTEGWITGLQLAALSLQGQSDPQSFIASFSGSHRFVLDYLGDEVLDQQPGDIREFLLKPSILERLCAPLCDALLEQTDSQQVLERLEQNNMFLIPLDDERRWYRYHHLFQDLLRQQLRLEHKEQLPELHGRASLWFEEQGLISDALHHALAVNNQQRAADLIATYASAKFMTGEILTVSKWLDLLPEAEVRADPRLCIALAWVYCFTQRPDDIAPVLQNAERGLKDVPLPDTKASLHFLRAYVLRHRGKVAEAITLFRKALASLPENHPARALNLLFLSGSLVMTGQTEAAIRTCQEGVEVCEQVGNLSALMGGTHSLATFYSYRGELTRALSVLKDRLVWAKEKRVDQLPAMTELYVALAEVYYEKNMLEPCQHILQEAYTLAERDLRKSALKGFILLNQARLELIAGHRKDTLAKLRQVDDLLSVWTPSRQKARVIARYTRIQLALGHLDKALEWANETWLADGLWGRFNAAKVYAQTYEIMTLARVLIASGTPQHLTDAAKLLDELHNAFRTAHRRGNIIEVSVLQALVHSEQGKSEEASRYLKRALSLAEDEGYARIFIDGGKGINVLIRTAVAEGDHFTYASQLLAQFPDNAQPTNFQEPAASSLAPQVNALEADFLEPLSQREMQVLRLVAAGLSNKQTAKQLSVTPGTVKKHLNNVFGKLGVHSRTQAVARARDLRILT